MRIRDYYERKGVTVFAAQPPDPQNFAEEGAYAAKALFASTPTPTGPCSGTRSAKSADRRRTMRSIGHGGSLGWMRHGPEVDRQPAE
jgi:hypothetical protein